MTQSSRYSELLREARKSVDYWADVTVTEFTNDLCGLMDAKGVGRSELAKRLGCSPAYVTQALGGANFQLSTMVKFAMALDAVVHVHVAPKEAIVEWREVQHVASEVVDSGGAIGDVTTEAIADLLGPRGSHEAKRTGNLLADTPYPSDSKVLSDFRSSNPFYEVPPDSIMSRMYGGAESATA